MRKCHSSLRDYYFDNLNLVRILAKRFHFALNDLTGLIRNLGEILFYGKLTELFYF
jgi:hypothetical protein